jgi:hypothetical protein
MFPMHSRWLLPAAFSAAVLTTQAQSTTTANAVSAAPVVRPDPLDPKSAVPALSYESSLSRYRRLSDDKAVSWRDANDTVGRIGGWRAYAREAQAPAASAASPAASSKPADSDSVKAMPMPMPQGHTGHKSP